MKTHRIGMLTGGGDAPGLNAVIRAVVKYGVGQKGWEAVGSEHSFNGFLDAPPRLIPLTLDACRGLLHRGGTVLGTTNRGDPFAFPDGAGGTVDRSAELAAAVRAEGLEGLVVLGGDGTQRIAARLMEEHGIPVIGVPKTIDNDLGASDYTFGFWSTVDVATDALDRLHTTAESHDRVMLLEVMGRDAGWIALYAGLAGGADCIAIPELPYDVGRFVDKIRQRKQNGREFTVVVVAEGAFPEGGAPTKHGAARHLADLLESRIDLETRVTVLGHIQRGGSPVPFDRVLATRFGVKAVELIEEGRWGELVCLDRNEVTSVPLLDAAGPPRLVDPRHPLIHTAAAVGIEFGALVS